MDDYQTVCRLDELTPGTPKFVVVDATPIAVFVIDDEVFALDDRCPHAGASLARGYVEGDVVRCRIHHWGFRIRDGKYIDSDTPCHDVRSIDVRVVDGDVQIKK